MGINPNRLLIQIKKKIVSNSGMKRAYRCPMLGRAMSSRTKRIIGSMTDWKPLGAFPSRFLYARATEEKISTSKNTDKNMAATFLVMEKSQTFLEDRKSKRLNSSH